MVVMKFGGSSVATTAALARVRAIVEAERRPRIVVVSALGGVTDGLLALTARAASGDAGGACEALCGIRERHASLAAAVGGEAERHALHAALDRAWQEVDSLIRSVSALKACSPAETDAIVARGELASSRLVATLLKDSGLPAEWVDARDVVVTDSRHEQALPLGEETAERLTRVVKPLVTTGMIPVLGGFIGATAGGVTTTLGRGGSDYSASLVGAGLGASEIQIWTDVDGILTADPRIFNRARPLDRLSFDEASALARFGAKVLHPSTVRPALASGIPVRVLNARRPAGRGTLVAAGPIRRSAPAAGIASLSRLCSFDVTLPEGASRPAALAAVFAACARAGAAAHLTAISDTGVSVVVDDGLVRERVAALLESQPRVVCRRGLALVAVVGDGLASGRGLARRALAACESISLHMVSRTPGSNHLALVVDQADLACAVAALHECLFGRQAEPAASRGRIDGVDAPFPLFGDTGQEVRA